MQFFINMGAVEHHNSTAPAVSTLEHVIQGHPVKLEAFTDFYGTPTCRLHIDGLDVECEWYHEPSEPWKHIKSQRDRLNDREHVNAWRINKRKLPRGVVQYKFRNELGHLAAFLLNLNN